MERTTGIEPASPAWRLLRHAAPGRESGTGGLARRMRAVFNGTVIAESDNTVVVEGNHYFPPESVHSDFLSPTDHSTVCPWKGTSSYYDVTVGDETAANAAWYFSPGAAASSRATSSKLNTTGRRRGSRTKLIFAVISGRPTVTEKKKRSAVILVFRLGPEIPPVTRCSWNRRRSSTLAVSGDRPRMSRGP